MTKNDKVLYWIPRILGIISILFISMFALDAFDSHLLLWEQIVGFLIHLIPSYFLIVILYVAWRWELIGGIILASVGLVLSPFIFYHNLMINHFSIGQCFITVLLINVPFIIVGGMFIINHFHQKKEQHRVNLNP